MKPEQILWIADKNGFDWFNQLSNERFTLKKFSANDHRIILYKDGTSRCGYIEGESTKKDTLLAAYSLSDLATNKSFLEALVKASPREDAELAFGNILFLLITNLTHNNGKDFWSICGQFLGENDE